MESSTHEEVQQEITRDERSALLGRLLESPQLKRSARLRQLLLYVGERALQSNPVAIHEQEIGVHVFGRTTSYDTSLDNIVRVNATELRKRLESYFTTEGADEQVVLNIPRGTYTPSFSRRHLSAEIQSSMGTAISESVPLFLRPSSVAQRSAFSQQAVLILLTGALVLIAACAFLLWQNATLRQRLEPWKSEPAIADFWSGFLAPDRDLDIVVADTSFALAEDMSQRQYSLDSYLYYAYVNQVQVPPISADRRSDLFMVLTRNTASSGDFRVAEQILSLDPVSPRLKLQFAREYTAAAIKHDNAVLIGSARSNPWVGLFEPQMNFFFRYDEALHLPSIINRHPKPGEQAVYKVGSGLPKGDGYSIIAFMPNLDHTANVLILEGSASQATEAAGDFITSESRLSSFRQLLAAKDFPYFEILLSTSHLVGTSLRSEVVAYRTYPRSVASLR